MANKKKGKTKLPKGKEDSRKYQIILDNGLKEIGVTTNRTPKQRKIAQEIFDRRLEVAKLLTEYGYNDTVISRLLEVSVSTIRSDREWLMALWLKTAVNDVEHAKQQLIRRKEFILDETRRAWERSKGTTSSRKKKEKKTTGGKAGNINQDETVESVDEHLGNPEYLKIFDKAADDIAELQGLKKDQIINKINITLPSLPDHVSNFFKTEEGKAEKKKKVDSAEDAVFVDIEELDEAFIRDRQDESK